TFFISTQFFYKHIRNAGDHNIWVDSNGHSCDASNLSALCKLNPNREVLPPELDLTRDPSVHALVEPVFITQPKDQYLQTLFITSSFRSGTISPSMVVFYDWGGAFVYQPGVTFLHDPFRFAIDYSILDAHIYKGGSGVSLLKDRDNVQFRFE